MEVTEDQEYLRERLNRKAKGAILTRLLLLELNRTKGTEAVTDALRMMHGFRAVYSPRSYLKALLDG